MAKKKAKKVATGEAKRKRRTDEELISDLKARIKDLRVRQQARELKQSPAIHSTTSAVKWIDKALDAAAEENNSHLRHALADARKSLEGYLVSEGLKLPKARLPRGRRPKA
jgi:glutamate-1-semialdehyde aminotransferase